MKKNALYLVSLLIIAGCSLDYSAVYVTEDMSEDLPDSILYDFIHTSVKNGIPVFRMSAGEAYIYNKKEQTQLSDIVFQEFDDAGNIATEGSADEAIFFTDSENAELWGNLYVYSASEEASFSTPYLYWSDEDKKLTGKDDQEVLIKRDSGTEIRGTGFKAEARTRTVEFLGPVIGTYVLEDEEEEQGEAPTE